MSDRGGIASRVGMVLSFLHGSILYVFSTVGTGVTLNRFSYRYLVSLLVLVLLPFCSATGTYAHYDMPLSL